MTVSTTGDGFDKARRSSRTDPTKWTVYCAAKSCPAHPKNANSRGLPVMNYFGFHSSMFSSKKTHVFVCSACRRQKWYRRSFFGHIWQRIR